MSGKIKERNEYVPIAVIGVSMRFPGAASIDEFSTLLASGHTANADLSTQRGHWLGIPNYSKLLENTLCIDDLPQFDREFFGISKREARELAPESRLLLEHAAASILDAGYSLGQVRGSRCGVVSAQSTVDHRSLVAEASVVSYLEGLAPLGGAHLGHILDLRGPSFCVDSTCSSSLLAVHLACGLLAADQADMMLAAGIQLHMPLDERHHAELFSGRDVECRAPSAFDASATGFVNGEGVGIVVLKRLIDAERDGDDIRGIIRGSAMSGNGARSVSTFAPSYRAQAEALEEACAVAGISINEITEIEGHGAGTLEGDSSEVLGLSVLADHIEAPVWLSSVKPSIGHSGAAAGVASLLKSLASFKQNVIYPIANFHTPHPDIDFEASGVRPIGVLEDVDPTQPRLAAVTSFGMSALNVVVLVEKPCPRPAREMVSELRIMHLSARTPTALERYRTAVRAELLSRPDEWADILDTLDTGRDDLPTRMAVSFRSPRQLFAALDNAPIHQVRERGNFIVDLREMAGTSVHHLVVGCDRLRGLRAAMPTDIDPDTGDVGAVLAYYCELGLVPHGLVDEAGQRDLLVRVVPELAKVENAPVTDEGHLTASVPYVLIGFTRNDHWDISTLMQNVVDLYACGVDPDWVRLRDSEESRRVSAPAEIMDKETVELVVPKMTRSISEGFRKPTSKSASASYEAGLGPGFFVFEDDPLTPWPGPEPTVMKPSYAEPTMASAESVSPPRSTPTRALECEAAVPIEKNLSRAEAEARVCEIWRQVLEIDSEFPAHPNDLHDSFFALGGNSLLGSMVVEDLNNIFGSDLLLKDIYELDTVDKQVARVWRGTDD